MPDSEFKILDYTKIYERIMQFDKNKTAYIHQWYPFVEGYSKEFINSIIDEIDYVPGLALDPFAGSGTTPLELQNLSIQCVSFEVSPFMHLLATVKLEPDYKESGLNDGIIKIKEFLSGNFIEIRQFVSIPLAKTFAKTEKLQKWIFDEAVLNGILDIKFAIDLVTGEIYRNLFKIALSSILLEVSNVYRDGKSVKYKSNWKDKTISRRAVHEKFLNKINTVILPDIVKLEQVKSKINNKATCYYGDVRVELEKVEDGSIDLVITSPPYLNSRDYTDIYIVELWMLNLVENYESLKELRSNTLRSHVEVKHGNVETIPIQQLVEVINKLSTVSIKHWNKELPSMIKGYFKDMEILFRLLKQKMKTGKKVFFNVANSAYYGIEIKVDEIIASIAIKEGFTIDEIRKARNLKPSSQQKGVIESLRETVIVMTS